MNHFKKLSLLATAALLSLAVLAGGCGSSTPAGGTESTKNTTITVGATPVPHSEILNEIKPLLAKEGIDLKIVEFTDYVKPNLALADGELDATFHQHVPFMDKFNSEHGTKLVSAGKVHVEPMGVYSHKIKDLKDVPQDGKVAIPNDPSNGGRALLILQSAGLITLKDGGNIASTVQDIVGNDKNLQFLELEAAQVPRSLDDVDIAVINTNFAMEAGLNPLKDALFLESKDSPYANILAIRAGDESRPEIQKLIKALQSPEVKKFIEDKYQGAILPSF
ncbi:MetQ/NlpA family ABC transporter substrate-binding protein [Megasphaera vaginalis (ex Srinivasan et al. 2021)]|uniref:Lipoprotein n=1 Tax=Megasphaera vaginalis (ex Srinivasan et al. 2021) TaxID=1111454 RepID=U7UJV0_9FIRM|nr:MetQ/NlpA family ABC transporter substrate-binding protein [Megasphaera vaginalis (ex Srinivasan et al. 2021)]ERT59692.1 lipoprotein, YaeC family [Megasphaera vaginalis (ex Srinivasan et al. 2021)]